MRKLALFVILTVFLAGSSGCGKSAPVSDKLPDVREVVFCGNVDENMEVVDARNSFSTGQVYAYLDYGTAVKTSSIKVTMYQVEGQQESIYDSADQECNPDWTVVAIPIAFDKPGKYKITFTNNSGDIKLGEGAITIE